jgi:hypothetical protein
MGTKNAATVAQNAYTTVLHENLHPEVFDHIVNFTDDFLGGTDTLEELLQVFERFLLMCKEVNITLNPKKVRFGFQTEQFYGFTIKKGSISPAEKNLDPIKNMAHPTTRSELRSIMGIFNQFSRFIKNYGKKGSPTSITKYTT